MTLICRPTYKCDGCAVQAAAPWRRLRFDHGWRMKAALPRGASKTKHYCPRCVDKGRNQ
jgi:hypothetical protein